MEPMRVPFCSMFPWSYCNTDEGSDVAGLIIAQSVNAEADLGTHSIGWVWCISPNSSASWEEF